MNALAEIEQAADEHYEAHGYVPLWPALADEMRRAFFPSGTGQAAA